VDVVEVLPAVDHPAVLELEDEAAADVQPLAVSLGGVATNADLSLVKTSSALQ